MVFGKVVLWVCSVLMGFLETDLLVHHVCSLLVVPMAFFMPFVFIKFSNKLHLLLAKSRGKMQLEREREMEMPFSQERFCADGF